VFLALILPLLAAEAFGLSGWLAVLAPLGFVVPDACLALVRRQRQRDVRQALSFFLDMMLSLLQAGLSLEEAFRRAAVQGLPGQHPLAEEVTRVSAELSVGRDSAFRALAERTGVQELIAVAEAVTLGLSRGVSLEATLKAQADLARARRREDGMRRLDKANAEILIPLLLCSFPMFVSLVIVPLGLQLMDGLELLARVLRP
jgi:tight adherence protein C